MAMEFLEFTFQSFAHFVGVAFLLVVAFNGTTNILLAIGSWFRKPQ